MDRTHPPTHIRIKRLPCPELHLSAGLQGRWVIPRPPLVLSFGWCRAMYRLIPMPVFQAAEGRAVGGHQMVGRLNWMPRLSFSNRHNNRSLLLMWLKCSASKKPHPETVLKKNPFTRLFPRLVGASALCGHGLNRKSPCSPKCVVQNMCFNDIRPPRSRRLPEKLVVIRAKTQHYGKKRECSFTLCGGAEKASFCQRPESCLNIGPEGDILKKWAEIFPMVRTAQPPVRGLIPS